MSFSDVIKKSVLEGFSSTDISTGRILVTLLIAYALAWYIHLVYKLVTKNSFYYKNYAVSMTIMSVITAGIILAMQSSLVISLGMVGALSIVRFRTAIKDPMDLLFLFWSISIGIICGAGLYELAILTSAVATIGIVLFEILPVKRSTYLLVINALSKECEDAMFQALEERAKGFNVKSKNISRDRADYIIELKLKEDENLLIDQLSAIPQIESVSLLENDVDVKS